MKIHDEPERIIKVPNVVKDIQEKEKLMHRNLWALFFIAVIYGFSSSPFFLVYQPFLLAVTGSLFITGILITIGGIIMFFPRPWVGKLSDHFNRKKIWLLDVPLATLGLFLLIFANNLTSLVMGICFYYISAIIGEISYVIFISESSRISRKGLMFGLMFFGINVGNVCGHFFVMLDIVKEIRIYFVIYIIFSLINFLITIFCISNPLNNEKTNPTHRNPHNRKKLWHNIFLNPKNRAVIIFFTLDVLVYNISLSIYNAGLRSQYNLTYEQLALVSISFSISSIVFQIPGGHLADKIGKKRTLIISELFGLSFFSILILAFILWSNGIGIFLIPFLSIGAILRGLCTSTFIGAQQMIITDLDETRKAESYGILGFLQGIGYLPTGIIGAILIESFSYLTPFIITFIGILFEIWILTKYFHE
ncbi:MAG: MFS transporter [Candidatus Hodarchaeota archaeon]